MSLRLRLAVVLVAAMLVLAGCNTTDPPELPNETTTAPVPDGTNTTPTTTTPGQETTPPSDNPTPVNETPTEPNNTTPPDDLTKPTISVIEPEPGYEAPANASHVVLKLTMNDDNSGINTSSFRLIDASDASRDITDEATINDSTVTASLSVDPGSSYTIVATVEDDAGNTGQKTIRFSTASASSDETSESTQSSNETDSEDDNSTTNESDTTESDTSDDSDTSDPYIPPPTEPENAEPTAVVGSDFSIDVDETASFDASESSDPDSEDTLSYTWDFDDGTTSTQMAPTHSFPSTGEYEVTLTVDDGWGGTDSATVNVTVLPPNNPPTADLYVNKSLVEDTVYLLTGDSIKMNASNSTDPDSVDTLSYAWNFNDGNTATGEAATRSYAMPGTYNLSLAVDDGRDGTDEDNVSVTVRDANQEPTADAGEDFSVKNMSQAQFDATATSDPEDDPLTYDWDFGDGSTSSDVGPSPTKTYMEKGTYEATLTVTDPYGATDTDTVTVTVTNNAPTATIDQSAGTYPVNATLAWNATQSSDLDNDTLSFSWDFDGDESTFERTGENITYNFTSTGDHTINLTADDGTDSNTTSVTITAANVAPVADAGPETRETVKGHELVFDASNSTDPNGGDTLTYEWDFTGDGEYNHSTKEASWTYGSAGTYEVELNVSDDSGNWDTTNVTVNVRESNEAPTAALGDDRTVENLSTVELNASASSDPEGDDLTYDWDFQDDGNIDVSEAGPTHLYMYPNEGEYTANVTVTDEYGASDSDIVNVTVTNPAPTATAGDDDTVVVGKAYTFDASDSSDPDEDSLTYDWDFGDGTTESEASAQPTHTYESTGEKTAWVNVTDADGANDSDIVNITVTNSNPIANAGENDTTTVGTAYQFDATASSDEDGHSLTYDWDFGDGTTESEASAQPTHTYDEAGEYEVTVTVEDGYGGTDTDTVYITVE